MRIFIKIDDYELGNTMIRGQFVLMTTVGGEVIETAEDQYTDADFMNLSKKITGPQIFYIVV